MPNELEGLKKQIEELISGMDVFKKDMEIKLEHSQKEVQQYKELAAKHHADLASFKEKTEADKKALERAQAEAKEKAALEYFQEQLKACRLAPAQKEAFLAFLKTLSSEIEVYTFSEKDGSKRSHTQLSLFKELFSLMPANVPSRGQELSRSNRPGVILPTSSSEANGATDEEVEHFAEIKDYGEKTTKKYPTVGFDLDVRIFEHMEEQAKLGRKIDYGTAMIEVSKSTGEDTRIPK